MRLKANGALMSLPVSGALTLNSLSESEDKKQQQLEAPEWMLRNQAQQASHGYLRLT